MKYKPFITETFIFLMIGVCLVTFVWAARAYKPKMDIDLESTYQVIGLQLPAASGEAIRQTTTITEANLIDLTDTGDTTLHDHDGISENTTHRSSDGTDHTYIDQDLRTSADVTHNKITATTWIYSADQVYGAEWNGELSVPTKNAVYDKVEVVNTAVGLNTSKVTESTSVTAPLVLTTYDVSIPVATTSADGYLSTTDWNTFNNKLSGNETITLTGDISGSGATAITTAIGADKVTEATLKAVNAAVDEYLLTYEATTGDFEWHQPLEVITAGTNLAWTGTTLDATDTNTQLTQEQVEDYAGALVTDGTGTHTRIAITYQDATGDVDFVVDNDLANYDNTNSTFLTGNETITLSGNVTGSGATAITTTIASNAILNSMIAADEIYDSDVNWGTGANQINTADIPELTNLYYTEARVSANTDVTANTAKTTESTTVTSPLALSTYDISIPAATNAAAGHASAAHITALEANTAKVTESTTVTSPLVLTTYDVSIPVADTTNSGYLSTTDWDTFNNKQTAGNYITALTGDITASGPGSVAATIAADVIFSSMVRADEIYDIDINWGTGANQVSAVDVPIADSGSIITGTEVETALQENRTAIDLNTAKETNVSTSLSVGTVGVNTVAITSDGGADDVTLPAATVSTAGMLTTAKWAEIVANTAKVTNTDDQTIDVFSISGDNVQLSLEDDGEATKTVDISTTTAVTANTAKVTNATHTGEVTGATALTIAADAVTYDKMQDTSGTDKVLGRSTAGAGTIEEIACTSAGRDLIDDADASAQRTTLGLGTIATQAANNVSISGGAVTGITDLTIADGGTGQSTAQLAINALTAVSGATNEHVLTKDTATGNAIFKVAAGGGSGDNISIDSVAVVDPDFVSTGDIDFVDTSNTVTANIIADKVTEAHLKCVNAAVDEYVLTYESTTGDFEWQEESGGGATSKIQDADADTGFDTEETADKDEIQGKVKGVEFFRAHNTGVITTVKQSAIRVYRLSGTDQTIPTATVTKIEFNGETYDVQNEFDPVTNHRFTAKTAGKYLISASCIWETPGDGTRLTSQIFKNGAITAETEFSPGADAYPNLSISDIINLSVNDYIEIFVYQPSGSGQDIKANTDKSFLNIHKLS
ncbi:MAG: hypothetical protein KAV18_06255 [Candidatus Omnitrophica bacterium]|nr:hypothetical protein [Candidatus Omnitrophota bacterium]